VALIHHYISQAGEEAAELPVHRQDAAVQHVGVGDEQVRTPPDLTTRILAAQATSMQGRPGTT
jgi:hypothetical protein